MSVHPVLQWISPSAIYFANKKLIEITNIQNMCLNKIPLRAVKKCFFYISLICLLSGLTVYPKTISATVINIEDAPCMLQGSPPVARCKPSVTITTNYENPSFSISVPEVDNGSYDPDGGGIGASLTTGDLAFGSNVVTMTVTDQDNNTSTCESHVVIIPDYGDATRFNSSSFLSPIIPYTGSYQDFYIPYEGDYSTLLLVLNGGDGGWARLKGTFCADNCKSRGGYGAKVSVMFDVGCGAGQLEPGGVLRFIIGEKGTKHNGTEVLCAGGASGSGGGGTGVLYKGLNDDEWTVLAAAGGGGGAYQGMLGGGCVDSSSGRDGNTEINGDGSDGKGSLSPEKGGKDGNGAGEDPGAPDNFSQYSGNGGGFLTAGASVNCLIDADVYYGGGKAGGITGGAGGSKEGNDCAQGRSGGFGFGGGGLARDAGAGGGGYSGGGAGGSGSGGGGGGSYVNTVYTSLYSLTTESYDDDPEDGYIIYQFQLASPSYASQTTASCIGSNTLSVALDENGEATLLPHEVDNGSTNDCNGPLFISLGLNQLSKTFDCDDLGTQDIFLYSYSYAPANSFSITDYEAIDFCPVSIQVVDNIPPVAACKNFTAQLGSNGTVILDSQNINNGSSDNCGIASYALSQNTFDCEDVGTQTVSLTVTDAGGNTSSCSSTITVSVNPSGVNPCCEAPNAVCKNIQATLGSGGAVSIAPADVDNGSTADCNIAEMSLDISTFDCNDLGDQTVSLTVTDDDGETGSCSATVTVVESYGLIARCKNINVQLDANGEVNILPADVDDGSESECGNILSTSLNNTSFDCNNIGTNTVTLTVTDEDETSTCTAAVTVADNMAPTANCIGSLTIELDAIGSASITNNAIDNSSTDNCTIASITLNQTTFDCADVGTFNLIQTVTDQSGNTSTCSVSASVEDNISPIVVCKDVTIQLDDNGEASVFADELISDLSESCFPINLSIDEQYNFFDCDDVGTVVVPVMLTDASNNLGTCNSTVTIVDDEAPTVICQDATVTLDASGSASISVSDINNGSYDNCSITSYSLSRMSFTCSDLGEVLVTLNAEDDAGNSGSCTATVTVLDEIAPTADCQDVTYYLDENGEAIFSVLDVAGNSTDNCPEGPVQGGITSFNPSLSDGTVLDCNDVGTQTIDVTISDASANLSTCSASITVVDNMAPTVICQNRTIQLDESGAASITVNEVNNNSTDNCGIASYQLSQTAFDCSHEGVNTLTLSVTDVNGNM